MNGLKDLAQLFITMVVVIIWAAMWAFSVANPDFVFPDKLNIVFLAVMAFNGFVVFQSNQIMKQKAIKDLKDQLAKSESELRTIKSVGRVIET